MDWIGGGRVGFGGFGSVKFGRDNECKAAGKWGGRKVARVGARKRY